MSIIDALNESIQNFKSNRARNRSSKPSPHHLKENSLRKLNSFSSDTENQSAKGPQRYFSSSKNKGCKDVLSSSQSSKFGNSDIQEKILSNKIPDCITSLSPIRQPWENNERKPNFLSENQKVTEYKDEISELFKQISDLRTEQTSLESQVSVLESKISQNLKDIHEPLRQTDFSNIINRIGGLQDKFSNRGKTSNSTEKISDLFEKISKLEFEAERIKKENNEVESLYHQTLNEIYDKIERLKSENKALTDFILSSPTSPKHLDNKEYRQKLRSENSVLHSEISLKKVIEEDDDEANRLFLEKEVLEQEKIKIQQELADIPPNSKSMTNKKKRQNLENELAANQAKIDEVLEKLQKYWEN